MIQGAGIKAQGSEDVEVDSMLVEVQIRGLMLDPVTNMPIVVLKDVGSDLAIALELEKAATPRPMTHDLLRNIARALNATVEKVVVSDLKEDTFYATIWMRQGDEPVMIDARPSDAIALALRWDCPIYVAKSVLGRTRQTSSGGGLNADEMSADELKKWLEHLNEDETGGYKM
jgi:bifunctional DNase/RNase